MSQAILNSHVSKDNGPVSDKENAVGVIAVNDRAANPGPLEGNVAVKQG